MKENEELENEVKLLKSIIINLFAIIENMNLIGSKTKKSLEYSEIKSAVSILKEEN